MTKEIEEKSLWNSPIREIISVSRLNEMTREVLESRIGYVWVEGEISNLARPASGHVYFSLKDAGAQVRCAMFRNRTLRLKCRPENGLHVVAYARASLYPARGEYQLIVENLEPAGDGLLQLRFEQLKSRLNAEGLFDTARKRTLPKWPRAVGVVTSPTGAAVRDVISILARRCPALPVIIYPTLVQGANAADTIVTALARANARAECDVLIVGRGGGSVEDLWPFNEERVARAIALSAIPVISAVGHEVDITIADFVADVRAPTPSAAAELVSPDVVDALRRVTQLGSRAKRCVRATLTQRRRELHQFRQRLVSPGRRLELNAQRLDELNQRLGNSARIGLEIRRGRLLLLSSKINSSSPASRIRLQTQQLAFLYGKLRRAWDEGLRRHKVTLQRHSDLLTAVGPTATLERGYSIVTDVSGGIVRDGNALKPGQELHTRLARGGFSSRVVSIADEPEDSIIQS